MVVLNMKYALRKLTEKVEKVETELGQDFEMKHLMNIYLDEGKPEVVRAHIKLYDGNAQEIIRNNYETTLESMTPAKKRSWLIPKLQLSRKNSVLSNRSEESVDVESSLVNTPEPILRERDDKKRRDSISIPVSVKSEVMESNKTDRELDKPTLNTDDLINLERLLAADGLLKTISSAKQVPAEYFERPREILVNAAQMMPQGSIQSPASEGMIVAQAIGSGLISFSVTVETLMQLDPGPHFDHMNAGRISTAAALGRVIGLGPDTDKHTVKGSLRGKTG